jgi:hypothetical protein
MTAYRLLLLLPIEYLSRSFLADFIKRALVADDLFSHLSVNPNHESNYVDHSLTTIRIFIKRVLTHVGHVEQPVSVIVLSLQLIHYVLTG